jgi:Spy/CpxP family protein refolding chaperone
VKSPVKNKEALMRRIAGLLMVILLASLLAGAQSPDPPKPFNRFWTNPMIVNQLGLTEQQIKQFDQLAVDTAMKAIDEHAALQKQQVQLMALFIPEKLDEAKFNQQVDSLLAAETRTKKTVISALLQGYNLLTPEQQKKAKMLLQNPEFMRHLGAGMGAGMGMGMGMGSGPGLGMGHGTMPHPPQPARPVPPPKP